jgi:type II secretory pathway pseudopilin PulG
MMRRYRSGRGLTLVEAVLLLTIVSAVAVGAGIGLQAVAKVPAVTESTMAVNAVAVNVLEQARANLVRNWPTDTWGGANHGLLINGASYTPSAGTALGSGYSTPIAGSNPSPVMVNNRMYQLTLTLAPADPGVGTAQADFMQVTVVVSRVIGGTASVSQRLVTYVAKP